MLAGSDGHRYSPHTLRGAAMQAITLAALRLPAGAPSQPAAQATSSRRSLTTKSQATASATSTRTRSAAARSCPASPAELAWRMLTTDEGARKVRDGERLPRRAVSARRFLSGAQAARPRDQDRARRAAHDATTTRPKCCSSCTRSTSSATRSEHASCKARATNRTAPPRPHHAHPRARRHPRRAARTTASTEIEREIDGQPANSAGAAPAEAGPQPAVDHDPRGRRTPRHLLPADGSLGKRPAPPVSRRRSSQPLAARPSSDRQHRADPRRRRIAVEHINPAYIRTDSQRADSRNSSPAGHRLERGRLHRAACASRRVQPSRVGLFSNLRDPSRRVAHRLRGIGRTCDCFPLIRDRPTDREERACDTLKRASADRPQIAAIAISALSPKPKHKCAHWVGCHERRRQPGGQPRHGFETAAFVGGLR